MPAYFREALIAKLAVKMGQSLDADAKDVLALGRAAVTAEREAMLADGQANPPEPFLNSSNSSWVRAFRGAWVTRSNFVIAIHYCLHCYSYL